MVENVTTSALFGQAVFEAYIGELQSGERTTISFVVQIKETASAVETINIQGVIAGQNVSPVTTISQAADTEDGTTVIPIHRSRAYHIFIPRIAS